MKRKKMENTDEKITHTPESDISTPEGQDTTSEDRDSLPVEVQETSTPEGQDTSLTEVQETSTPEVHEMLSESQDTSLTDVQETSTPEVHEMPSESQDTPLMDTQTESTSEDQPESVPENQDTPLTEDQPDSLLEGKDTPSPEGQTESSVITGVSVTAIQRNAYQLTINNPEEKGLGHEEIKKRLINNFKTLKFFCMADEVGLKSQTYHTHIYVYFSSRVRLSKVRNAFDGQAHIEITHGSPLANIEYVKKSGKWEGTLKEETRVEGTYFEYGNLPTQKGSKIEMEELYEMVKNGYSNAEILAINNDYILQIDKLDKLRTMLLQEKYKGERRLDLKVIYISGATGTGKTRGVLDTHGDANVYRVNDYNHPFDQYACQSVMMFDEFRSQLPLSDMLQYCDIYPTALPARYSNKYACYTVVYIVSNWPLEDQYTEARVKSPESWNAFLRRIHEVRVYNRDGTVDTYNSTQEYLNRPGGLIRGFVRVNTGDVPFAPKPPQNGAQDTDEDKQIKLALNI